MATKDDFTEDEWKAMQKGAMGAGTFVSGADRDFTDSFGEAGALAKYLAAQRTESDSALIRELAKARKTGFGITASPQEVETGTLDAIRVALAAISAKAPDDLEAYRRFVLGTATAVAEAKSGVSPEEAAAIESIKGALGTA